MSNSDPLSKQGHTCSCVPSSVLSLPSHAVKEKNPDSPADTETLSQPGHIRVSSSDESSRGPSPLCYTAGPGEPTPLPGRSAHPAPDVLTPHRPRHSPRQLHSWPNGLWDNRPANRPEKEGKQRTPQTNSGLPEPKHAPVRGLSRQAGGGLGGLLNPFSPSTAPRSPLCTHHCHYLALQPDVPAPHPSQQTLLVGQGMSFLAPQGTVSFIHSLLQRQGTRRQGLEVLSVEGPCSHSDLATAVHLLWQLLTARL